MKYEQFSFYIINSSLKRYLGGYSSGVPPLPIPNREVKPTRADGTALHRGRVGRRRFSREFIRMNRLSFCIYTPRKLISSGFLVFLGD